jgi:hypothetical protein
MPPQTTPSSEEEALQERLAHSDSFALRPTPMKLIKDLSHFANDGRDDKIDNCLTWGSALLDSTSAILKKKWFLFKIILLQRRANVYGEGTEGIDDKHDDPAFYDDIAYKLVLLNSELLTFSVPGQARCTVMHEAAFDATRELFEDLVMLCRESPRHTPDPFRSFTTQDQDGKTPLHQLILRDDQTHLLEMVSLVLDEVEDPGLDLDTLYRLTDGQDLECRKNIIKKFIESRGVSPDDIQEVICSVIDDDLQGSFNSLLMFLDVYIANCQSSHMSVNIDVVVQLIIRMSKEKDTQLLSGFCQTIRAIEVESLRGHKLLHRALKGHVKKGVIEALIQRCPELVIETDENHTPMAKVDASQNDIRELIAGCILRLQPNKLTSENGNSIQDVLRTIRQLLEDRDLVTSTGTPASPMYKGWLISLSIYSHHLCWQMTYSLA